VVQTVEGRQNCSGPPRGLPESACGRILSTEKWRFDVKMCLLFARFEVLTAVLLKIQVCWDVTPCGWINFGRFAFVFNVKQPKNRVLGREDGGDTETSGTIHPATCCHRTFEFSMYCYWPLPFLLWTTVVLNDMMIQN
jgi:hypothetical protein